MYKLLRELYWQMPRLIRNLLGSFRFIIVRNYFLLKSKQKRFDWQRFYVRELKSVNPSLIYVFEPNIGWHSALFQRPQHMARALGQLGKTAIYCSFTDGLTEPEFLGDNVWIVPFQLDAEINGVNRIIYSTSHFCTKSKFKNHKKSSFIIYEYVDHVGWEVAGGWYEAYRQRNLKTFALERANLIVTTAKILHDEAVALAQNVKCIPNGADVIHFLKSSESDHPVFAEILELKSRYRFVLGYYGAIAPWIWFELITHLSSELCDVAFVFIGPKYGGEESLPNSPNIYYFEAIDYQDLPPVASLFDVAFIPFKLGDVAKSTSPLKMFEYMALGKPVVVTSDLSECIIYPEVFHGSDLISMKNAINEAYIKSKSASFNRLLYEIASANTWLSRAEQYIKTVEGIR
jgi:teichuronic acid biosynthesis glycosyltransferase TuaH